MHFTQQQIIYTIGNTQYIPTKHEKLREREREYISICNILSASLVRFLILFIYLLHPWHMDYKLTGCNLLNTTDCSISIFWKDLGSLKSDLLFRFSTLYLPSMNQLSIVNIWVLHQQQFSAIQFTKQILIEFFLHVHLISKSNFFLVCIQYQGRLQQAATKIMFQ